MTMTAAVAVGDRTRDHAAAAGRPTIGARLRAAGMRYVAAREATVHRDMVMGRYGPEAAAARRASGSRR